MSRIIAGRPNPHEPCSGTAGVAASSRRVQGGLAQQLSVEADDPKVEIGQMEVDLGALPAPPNGDVEELRALSTRVSIDGGS